MGNCIGRVSGKFEKDKARDNKKVRLISSVSSTDLGQPDMTTNCAGGQDHTTVENEGTQQNNEVTTSTVYSMHVCNVIS